MLDNTNFELILVNDGGGAEVWEEIKRAAERYDWVRGVDLTRNFGQQGALLCGARLARYDTIVTMDDDLQHPPEEIGKLLQKLDEGYDLVYGRPAVAYGSTPKRVWGWRPNNPNRRARPAHPWHRRVGSRAARWLLRLVMNGNPLAADASSFRAFRSSLRDSFADYDGPPIPLDALLFRAGARYAAVDVAHAPRLEGRSGYTLAKLVGFALDLLSAFGGALPMRRAGRAGCLASALGGSTLAFLLNRATINGNSAPVVLLAGSAMVFLAGALFMMVGLGLERALGRRLRRLGPGPPYEIREIVGWEKD